MQYVASNLLFLFLSASQTFELPKGLISALCYQESRHKVTAVNPADGGEDSLGVCQIKEGTARQMGFKGTRADLMLPKNNVYYSAKYLRKMLDRYSWDIPKALAAYNAGPKNVSITGELKYKKYPTKVLKYWVEGR